MPSKRGGQQQVTAKTPERTSSSTSGPTEPKDPRSLVVSWSGGKDSTLALRRLLSKGLSVTSLLSTITEGPDRISMHGVREILLDAQARSLRLPVEKVRIPAKATNEIYEERMGEAVSRLISHGIRAFAFGDLFLEDVRAYREEMLRPTPAEALFPLWLEDTHALARSFIEEGFQAIVTTVDKRKLDPSFAGRTFDLSFLRDLPSGVDPMGERGEFHTFVHQGPLFRDPVPVKRGARVERDGFVFQDLLPA